MNPHLRLAPLGTPSLKIRRGGWGVRASRLIILLLALLIATAPLAAQQVQEMVAEKPGPLLTLEEALGLAREGNYAVRVARNQAEIAENDHSLGNADLLPTLRVSAQQSRRPAGSFSGAPGDPGFGGGFDNNTVDLTASVGYTVFDGFRRAHTLRRLGVEEERAEIEGARVLEDVLADVEILYYDIARQQQQIEALRAAVEISEERLRIAELRLGVGTASVQEVRRARVDLNADLSALLRQETTLVSTKAALNQFLAREQGSRYHVVDSIPVDRSLEAEALRAAAVEQNRAVRVAERGREIAALERREVRSDWYPTVDLSVGYAFSDASERLGFEPLRDEGWTYGLTVGVDVFDGFNRRRRLQNARLRQQSRELELEQIRTRVLAELESTYERYRNSLVLEDLERESLVLAEQNVEVALERFRLGMSTSVELREVQNALTDARSRLANARFEAKQAEIELLLLSGEIVP